MVSGSVEAVAFFCVASSSLSLDVSPVASVKGDLRQQHLNVVLLLRRHLGVLDSDSMIIFEQ